MPIQLKVRTTGATLVRQGLEDFTREVPLIGRKRIYDMMREAKSILSTPGSPISYPVQWDSEKQRIYVIAMLRDRNNLPYQRTGNLPDAWKIERDGEGYTMYNSQPAAVYVYGNYEGARQSRIHRGRHPVMQEVLETRIQGLPSEIEEAITYYGRQKGL